MPKRTVKWNRDGTQATYFLDGVEVTKDEYDKKFPDKPLGVPLIASPAIWQGFESLALAVHPDQVAEATKRNQRHGCSVTYKEDGTAVIPDRAERKKVMKLDGLHDREGGYGD